MGVSATVHSTKTTPYLVRKAKDLPGSLLFLQTSACASCGTFHRNTDLTIFADSSTLREVLDGRTQFLCPNAKPGLVNVALIGVLELTNLVTARHYCDTLYELLQAYPS